MIDCSTRCAGVRTPRPTPCMPSTTGSSSASDPVRPLVALEDAGATVLWQERTLVDRPLVDALRDAAMQLIVWTVDDPADMERLLAVGVDGICTNRPEIGRRAVDAQAA